MRFYQRKITIRSIVGIPLLVFHLFRCFFLFKNPILLIYSYLSKIPPASKIVELKNGYKIFITEDSEDIPTIFAIFGKKEYGNIDEDSVIIDIGANIGAFSIYALCQGAAKVYAYEPCQESYDCLVRSINESKIENAVFPERLAVTDSDDKTVCFPRESSGRNKILIDDELCEGQYDMVDTTSLKTIFKNNLITRVDLLKLDCEGAEYDILLKADNKTLSVVKNIKLEYHKEKAGDICSHLAKHGFIVKHHQSITSSRGVLWLAMN